MGGRGKGLVDDKNGPVIFLPMLLSTRNTAGHLTAKRLIKQMSNLTVACSAYAPSMNGTSNVRRSNDHLKFNYVHVRAQSLKGTTYVSSIY